MPNNQLMIAAAGSGKTTYLIGQALAAHERNILITTYTEENETEIKRKFISECGCIPKNVIVMTWFSFLIRHGVKPFQDHILDVDIKGMILVSQQSGLRYKFRGRPVYWPKTIPDKYYISSESKLYSDKISQLVLECDAASNGDVITRLQKIFDVIYVDEVQDLAGYDLDIIHELFKSKLGVLLVGDPRQVTYLTHNSRKYKKYQQGKIVEFVTDTIKKAEVFIDTETLNCSHRNSASICEFSSKLYPEYSASSQCTCEGCHPSALDNDGIVLVRPADVDSYIDQFSPVQLRWDKRTKCSSGLDTYNFGQVKGLGFERVLIYPTEDMRNWVSNHESNLTDGARAKLYVALTRAKLSSAIIYDFDEGREIEGAQNFIPTQEVP